MPDAAREPTDEEFCGLICLAASKMRIPIGLKEKDNTYQYVFADFQLGNGIGGEFKPTKKEALMSACVALQNYFNPVQKKV